MLDHSMMNHTNMDHSMMNHTNMDHSMMNHTNMDHSMMNHTNMDHSMMNHSNMDHSNMDHGQNHSNMDHGHHNHPTGMGGGMAGMGDMTGMGHGDHGDHTSGLGAGHGGHMDHMMKMYFHDGYREYVLFKECQTKSTEAMIGACFAVFAVAVLYEGLKYFRESLMQRSLVQAGQSRSSQYQLEGKQTQSQEQMVMQIRSASVSSRMLSCGHFAQTLLHVIQVFISYCLMLVFMTYNVWLCLAVVVGAGVGYFLFGWKRAVVVDANEHCH